MIVGRGLIASLFTNCDREDTVFFASGVSNSLETRPEEFNREENLIKQTIAENPDKVLVYFSTCSIYDSSKTESNYVLHKLKMEQIVKNLSKNFLILRVSNAVGKGGNPNLLMNYIVNAVKNNETINVHTKATRNLIDVEDVKNITFKFLDNKIFKSIINVAYLHNYSIIEILELIEELYNKKANINLIKSGSGYEVSIPIVEKYFIENNLHDKKWYLRRLLKKYY